MNEDLSDPKEELIFFTDNYKIDCQTPLREKAEFNSNIAKQKNKTYTAKLWLEFADIFCPKQNPESDEQL